MAHGLAGSGIVKYGSATRGYLWAHAPSPARELAFRHFFRQAYAYVLNWEDRRDLVERLQPTWASVKTEIEAFLDT